MNTLYTDGACLTLSDVLVAVELYRDDPKEIMRHPKDQCVVKSLQLDAARVLSRRSTQAREVQLAYGSAPGAMQPSLRHFRPSPTLISTLSILMEGGV